MGTIQKPSISADSLPSGLRLDSILPRKVFEFPATILILGPPDSGKSTLTDLLVGQARRRGIPVGWIDADPGQTRLGLPSCIWGAMPGRGVLCGGFVGALSPAGQELRFATAVLQTRTRLEALGAKLILVDSPGFVFGRQARLMHRLLNEMLMPDRVLAIEGDNALAPLLRATPYPCVFSLPRLPGCRRRSRTERKRRHRQEFDQHFSASRVVRVSLVGRSCWMLGAAVRPNEIGSHLLGHVVGFTLPPRPVVGQIVGMSARAYELSVRLPTGRVPQGPLVIGTLRRSPAGVLSHEPQLADPGNLEAHFPSPRKRKRAA